MNDETGGSTVTEQQFSELRPYRDHLEGCLDNGYKPLASLVRNGWLREIVRDCWQITPLGVSEFDKMRSPS